MKINIKNIRIKSICVTLFISIFLSCNSGVIEELEKKNTFFDSLVKIGHVFQEMFGSFGNSIGDALGFSAVKSDDTRDKIGKHFEKVGEGLKNTKTKLEELSKQIVSTSHADTKEVEAVISTASEMLTKLIDSVAKIAEVTKQAGEIVAIETGGGNAVGAHKESVDVILKEVKEIIETAKEFGINIEKGNPGNLVEKGDDKAGAALVGKNTNAQKPDAKAGPLLADEVSKADPWAMIDKIQNANTSTASLSENNNNEAGALATRVPGGANQNGAKTNADLAAAVALKAMTKGGKFAANNSAEEAGAVKAAAANAVNKVLGILDVIIIKTVIKNLEKVREVVKKIEYSETTGTGTTEANPAK
ncbi:variable large family protein (plasmid) [Borrelia coriaceae]|uniref:Variable large protein n=1 Tax=Borrelia coriaceae ATCC 43381 TaxID=1408429 RepID=W5SWW3_9SPIR|nr:variable large family protein [Borrelia coriaceae]AHH11694.1 Variable major protein [Borrelia coriaceae ATCC 43381]UPA17183.1 variable large family protein [Borrelia coriaceae]